MLAQHSFFPKAQTLHQLPGCDVLRMDKCFNPIEFHRLKAKSNNGSNCFTHIPLVLVFVSRHSEPNLKAPMHLIPIVKSKTANHFIQVSFDQMEEHHRSAVGSQPSPHLFSLLSQI